MFSELPNLPLLDSPFVSKSQTEPREALMKPFHPVKWQRLGVYFGPRGGPNEAHLHRLPVSVLDCHSLVIPVESCPRHQSERARCVSNQCPAGRSKGSSQDSRQLRQVPAALRGESRTD